MQVLVADDEIASRVLVETALRERGHTVRNSEDGFDAAKILSSPGGPKIAVLSNTLARLRGLDVCRFLSAMGRKTGVYVILVTDVADMELVELCRRAGVDGVVRRPLTAAAFHLAFDAAERVVELEGELGRIHEALRGFANFSSPVERRANVLREANAALLDPARKKDAAPTRSASAPAEAPAERPAEKPAPRVAPAPAGGSVYRGIRIVPEAEPPRKAPAPAGEVRSLLDEPSRPAASGAKPSQSDIDAILFGGGDAAPKAETPAPDAHDEEQRAVLAGAQQVQDAELADEEIIHPFEFDELILKVFSGMGVTLKTELPPLPLPDGPVFASWVGVAIPSEPVWMDLVLVAGEKAGKAVTAELLGQEDSGESDVCEMFAELQNMLQGSLRRYLEENGHSQVLQIAIPRASFRSQGFVALPKDLAPVVESGFSFGGESVRVMLFEHREFATCTNVFDLNCYDFLCDAVNRPGEASSLLVQGAVIRIREKEIAAAHPGVTNPFRVMHASPFARAVGPEKLLDLPGTPCCVDNG
jgi:CheY-like chemotaxis protein